MKFAKLIQMILEQTKPVVKIKTGNNESHKCENRKDFYEALSEIKKAGHNNCRLIVDANGEKIYVVGGDSFHKDLAKKWELPLSSGQNFLHLVGVIDNNKFVLDELHISPTARKKLKSLDPKNWISSVLNVSNMM